MIRKNRKNLLNVLHNRKNFLLFSGLFFSLGLLLLYLLQKFSPLVGHAAYYCVSFIETNLIPIPHYLTLFPIVLLGAILIISIMRLVILTIKMQFLQHKLHGKKTIESNVSEVIKKVGLANEVIVINTNDKFAFCMGIKSPKIYISTGLINDLTLLEIESVLRHEQYHLQNHDTFIMLIASISYTFFPYLPILGDLIKRYRIEREIEADKYAIEKIRDSYHLISALKKLLAFPTKSYITQAAIADHDTLEQRICSILKKPYKNENFRLKNLLITLGSMIILGGIIVFPVNAREIHHEEHDVVMVCTDGDCMNSCTSDRNLDKLFTDIPPHSSISLQ